MCMGHGHRSWVLVVGGHGLMVALVAEDGGGRSGHGLMVAVVTEDGGGGSFQYFSLPHRF